VSTDSLAHAGTRVRKRISEGSISGGVHLCAAEYQPMGFYSPATLIKDAQRHGLKVRPVDVTRSDWNCTLARLLKKSIFQISRTQNQQLASTF
jgi:hypothetical protein